MAKGSAAEADRARISEIEHQRELRVAAWSMTRNEGIREGLLMAISALWGESSKTGNEAMDHIRTRGNRHFGDSKWQTEPRAR